MGAGGDRGPRAFGLGGYCSPAGGGPVTEKGLWAGPERKGATAALLAGPVAEKGLWAGPEKEGSNWLMWGRGCGHIKFTLEI